MPPRNPRTPKQPPRVETLTHAENRRLHIPSAEHEAVLADAERSPIRVAYERRNRDLDPQLVWRGKDQQDWSDLVVAAPPLYIQEKIHPKVLIDDLLRQSQARAEAGGPAQLDLFADFNLLPAPQARTEFYQHEARWTNRMILGDSLQVMASLAEREGLRGRVQAIYLDPPYGIKFNSNFQWSTTSRDVKDGKADHITREPEQVRAFRDTWRDGIHSYLTYLRDRLTVARDLLTESGSIFVQIGDENVHRVRTLMDEVFGEENFVAMVSFQKTGSLTGNLLPGTVDYIIWCAKNKINSKYRQLYKEREAGTSSLDRYDYVETADSSIIRISAKAIRGEEELPIGERCRFTTLLSDGVPSESKPFNFRGKSFPLRHGKHWKTDPTIGGKRLVFANRVVQQGETVWYKRFVNDFSVLPMDDRWESIQIGRELSYVVQTATEVVKRCLLMTTDPGDLVLDPTCGSGTTAYVAEQWGRRWITIDTSRVALALARARLMGARYPYYILKDSPAGQRKEAELTQSLPAESPTYGSVRQGFVYERVPHITLKSIANNSEIDVIWKEKQPAVVAALEALNGALAGHATPYRVTSGGREGQPINFSATGSVTLPSGEEAPANSLLEWEVPREAPTDWPTASHGPLAAFWQARIARQRAIDASIAAKADYEYLYDKPYEERNLVRVAGPFTVESLSPHRVLAIDADDRLIPHEHFIHEAPEREGDSFSATILESLRVAGVQQAHKADKISFTSLSGWPGRYICAEGHYQEASSGAGRRAGIFIGPEFGTVGRADLVAAAREAGDAGFDLLIACAFNYDAHAADFASLGRIPVLKARMNADLHMADALKDTGAGNLFVIFGEPDIDVTTGHWVTTRDGRPVAHYEQLCALTGLTSLDAINRTDPKQLHALCNRASRSTADGGRGNLQHTHLLRALNTLSAGDLPLSLSSGPKVQVTIHGVDIFRPNSGEVSSSSPAEIACWFIDSDYNEESFFVRQAYFLGAVDSYKALKSSLRAEIDEEAWASLYGSCSRPFDRPKTGRIAVKVINHLGDEVMKVFHVGGAAGEKRKEE